VLGGAWKLVALWRVRVVGLRIGGGFVGGPGSSHLGGFLLVGRPFMRCRAAGPVLGRRGGVGARCAGRFPPPGLLGGVGGGGSRSGGGLGGTVVVVVCLSLFGLLWLLRRLSHVRSRVPFFLRLLLWFFACAGS